MLKIEGNFVDNPLEDGDEEGIDGPNRLRNANIQVGFLRDIKAQGDSQVDARLESTANKDNKERPPVESVVPLAQKDLIVALAARVEHAALVTLRPLALVNEVYDGKDQRA